MIELLLGGAIAIQTPRPPLATAQQPVALQQTIAAIDARDQATLKRLFGTMQIITLDGIRQMNAREVLRLLGACRRGDARQLIEQRFEIGFECPTRRAEATGCYTGDLSVIVNFEASPGRLTVTEKRKTLPSCRVFAPPPPPLPR